MSVEPRTGTSAAPEPAPDPAPRPRRRRRLPRALRAFVPYDVAVRRLRPVQRAALTLWSKGTAWFPTLDLDEGIVLLAVGALIGVAAGLGVVLFYRMIDVAYLVFITWLGDKVGAGTHAYYRPALTAAGLWVAWWIVKRTRLPEGQTVPDVQLAVTKHGGRVPARRVAIRTLVSAITLGSGGSAGSEGPTAVLGAAVGSGVGRGLRLQPRQVKILVGCGAAAGISAAFNAPFAGAFFALEEVLGAFSVGAFSPVVMASVAGALTVRPFLGSHPAFHVPLYGTINPWVTTLLYPLLGIGCGLVSAFYARLYFRTADWFRSWPGPAWLRPTAGGFLVGLIVLFSGGLLVGNGHLAIPTPVFGQMAWYLLLALTLAKIVATTVTLGCGGSGGVFTPTLFIGAALGGGLGRLAADLLPAAGIHPEAWGIVGMAGLVAGATRAPLTAIFMVFDMTDDYRLVPPLMVVAVLAYVAASRWSPYGLYDGWLARRGEHIAHGADRALMERLQVAEALDRHAVTVPPEASLADIIAASGRTRYTALPVVDEEGTLHGIIFYDSLRQALLDRGDLAPVLLAADLAAPSETVSPHQSLREALTRMNARALDVLPVVDSAHGDRFLGTLSRADLLAAYERQLVHEV